MIKNLLDNKRAVFWTRMTSWVGVSCITPIVVFATKFGLFEKEKYTPVYDELGNVINKTPPALNGWGIVSCIVIGFTILSILKEVAKAYTGYSLAKQVIVGITSAVPLVIALAVCYFLEGVIDNVKYCLIVLIITKIASAPLNPLPKWRFEKNGVENYDDFISTISKYITSRKEG
jgi:hypothetical protein